MILPHEQVGTAWYFFLSEVSNSAGKNEFTYLQPHFYVKYKIWKCIDLFSETRWHILGNWLRLPNAVKL